MRTTSACLALSLAVAVSAQTPQSVSETGQLETRARQELVKKGWDVKDIQELRVTSSYVDGRTGILHAYLRQCWAGIPLEATEVSMHVRSNGELLALKGRLIPDLENRLPHAPSTIGPVDALAIVATANARQVDLSGTEHQLLAVAKHSYRSPEDPRIRMTAELIYAGWSSFELVWKVSMHNADPKGDLVATVRADDGKFLGNANVELNDCTPIGLEPRVAGQAPFAGRQDSGTNLLNTTGFGTDRATPPLGDTYRAYSWPAESPDDAVVPYQSSEIGALWLEADPVQPHWNSNSGYNAFNTLPSTEGINVDCRLLGSGTVAYDQDPYTTSVDMAYEHEPADPMGTTENQNAALVNAFVWMNYLHDLLYTYGFNEVSGNFQEWNGPHGGIEGDRILVELGADEQDCGGAGSMFAVDGVPGSIVLPVYCTSIGQQTEYRHSAYDHTIITHEYAHGLLVRMVGGPAVHGLAYESGVGLVVAYCDNPMEGLCDFLGLITTIKDTDTRNSLNGHGAYAYAQPPSGAGSRHSPYTTDPFVNPWTYEHTDQYPFISDHYNMHARGYILCTALWELTWDLIAAHGFEDDLYEHTSTAGNVVAMKLFVESLRYMVQTSDPVDVRDSYLTADAALFGGAHEDMIWAAFARRGLGVGASSGCVYYLDPVDADCIDPEQCFWDEVASFDVPACKNVRVERILEPWGGKLYDCNSDDQMVSVLVKNAGTCSVKKIAVRYQMDGMANPVEENIMVTIPAGQTLVHTFATPFTLNNPGPHELKARTRLLNDENPSDDEKRLLLELVPNTPLSTPMHEDFQLFDLCNMEAECEDRPCTLQNGWLNLANYTVDDVDWRTNAGNSGNPYGPSVDYTIGDPHGKFVQHVGTSGCTDRTLFMESPCIDLTGLTNPVLSFALNCDALAEVGVEVKSGNEWLDLGTAYSGNTSGVWELVYVPLSSVAGSVVNLRLKGYTGSTTFLAVDDIWVDEQGVRAFAAPRPPAEARDLQVTLDRSAGILDLRYLGDQDAAMEWNIYDALGRSVMQGSALMSAGWSERMKVNIPQQWLLFSARYTGGAKTLGFMLD